MTADAAKLIAYETTDPPAPGEVREVAPGTLWVRLPLPFVHTDHVNAYILDDGDSWTIYDTGSDLPELRALWQTLLTGPLSGKPLRRVIASHHHTDHLGLAGWFQSEHGAELAMPRTGWLLARMLCFDRPPKLPAETLALFRSAGMDADRLARRAADKPFYFSDMVADLPLGMTRIDDGDLIRAGGRDWRVHFGSGHAPDHMVLFSEDGDLVLGGDQILPTITPPIGIQTIEPNSDPVGEWIASAERLSAFATDRQLVLPGHQFPYRGLPGRLAHLVARQRGALDRTLALLDRPRTAAECFPALYRREIAETLYDHALRTALAHCNHLLRRGAVRRWKRDDGVWLWQATGKITETANG